MNNSSRVIIWRFTDGRGGHDSQSLGLVSAINQLLPVESFDFDVTSMGVSFFSILFKRPSSPRHCPAPDLLLGAGHATHWPMLAARRGQGGRIVVLMKPSLPLRWFDAVVAPRHDRLAAADNVFISEGVLNSLRPASGHQPGAGLIMLGGPSVEYRWHSTAVVDQIKTLIRQRPGTRWTVTSSRRTPPAIMERISQLDAVQAMPHRLCPSGWLAEQLSLNGEVWVTEDSVSMLYEALSCGARVGVIKVPRAKPGRVASGIDSLVNEGRVPQPGSFQLTSPDAQPLQEALRCAQWLQQKWLDH